MSPHSHYIASPARTAQEQEVLTVAFHNYERALTARAFSKIHNQVTGKDLVQETFLKAWRYLSGGGEIHVMKAFLYHILNNLIVDEYRKHKQTSLDELQEKGFEPSCDDTERLTYILDGKAAQHLIPHLPPVYRRVMRMRYVQDLPLDEIVHRTGHTKNSLAVQAHRGLKKLQKIYQSVE